MTNVIKTATEGLGRDARTWEPLQKATALSEWYGRDGYVTN